MLSRCVKHIFNNFVYAILFRHRDYHMNPIDRKIQALAVKTILGLRCAFGSVPNNAGIRPS